MKNGLNWLACTLTLAATLSASAGPKPPAPVTKITPEQAACIQRTLGKNTKPTPLQLADATRACVNLPKAPDKPAAPTK